MKVESDGLSLSISLEFQQTVALDDQLEKAIEEAALTIKDCHISTHQLRAPILRIFSLRPWENLVTLSLSNSNLSNMACKALSMGKWTHLNLLMLDNNKIQAIGVLHLAKAQMPSLNELWLMSNRLASGGVKQLGKLRSRELSILYVDRNYMPLDELFNIFQAEWPKLQICYTFQNQQVPSNQWAELANLKFKFLEQFYSQ